MGHVNMMDDVLISNLPPELLRSSLRTLVSLGSSYQQPFVQYIRQHLIESAPEKLAPEALFAGDDITEEGQQYLGLTRCIFSSKLSQEALSYLTHFVTCLNQGGVTWSDGSNLANVLSQFNGDVVQAVQTLKEAKMVKLDPLKQDLDKLLIALDNCFKYCQGKQLQYPFQRCERQVADILGTIFPGSITPQGQRDAQPAALQVTLQESDRIEKMQLGPHPVPRLFNGFWQLSSPAWGSGSSKDQDEALTRLVQSGLVAADTADHYGDAELIYGDFRNKLSEPVRDRIYAATKWCVFSPPTQPMTPEWVLAAVEERCRRLGGRVDLLQFHWYDYNDKEYLDILAELVRLTRVQPDLVSSIGLCNFDSAHTEEACEYLLKHIGEVGLVSNQVQFSLLDSRPVHEMTMVCNKYGLKLLTYGSFCGGFLSEKWLGQPEPQVYGGTISLTPSQRKYLDMVHNWGNWTGFQSLLSVLSDIAKVYNVTLTNVATRWVLQQESVGAVIVGTRLGVSAHGDENLAVFDFALTDADLIRINDVALGHDGKKSRALFEKLGDCGNEYRKMY